MDLKTITGNTKYLFIAVALIIVILIVIYLATSNNNSPVVATGDNVSVYYTGTLTNGTVFDSNVGQDPLKFTVGSGEVIQGFDQAVIGMKLNETKNITIPANDAYGPVNPNLIVKVPISEFGNQSVHVGETVSQQSSDGQQVPGVITALNSTTATVDFNSPLAGQTLIFSIKVVAIQENNSK